MSEPITSIFDFCNHIGTPVFVRLIGCPDKERYIQDIYRMDKISRPGYIRIDMLERVDASKIRKYLERADEFFYTDKACKQTILEFRKSIDKASDKLDENLIEACILYWFNKHIKVIGRYPKLVIGRVTNTIHYLFAYYAYLIGYDVLLLMPDGDRIFEKNLQNLSQKAILHSSLPSKSTDDNFWADFDPSFFKPFDNLGNTKSKKTTSKISNPHKTDSSDISIEDGEPNSFHMLISSRGTYDDFWANLDPSLFQAFENFGNTKSKKTTSQISSPHKTDSSDISIEDGEPNSFHMLIGSRGTNDDFWANLDPSLFQAFENLENTRPKGEIIRFDEDSHFQRDNRSESIKDTQSIRKLNLVEVGRLSPSIVMIQATKSGNLYSQGSGIAIGKGYILTNYHVVKNGVKFRIDIEEQGSCLAECITKIDAQHDLALLYVNHYIKPIPIFDGNRQLEKGEEVVAIGSPNGLFNSISNGIISGFRQESKGDTIQFTAAISPGNSGGALLNMYGQLLGVTTYSRVGRDDQDMQNLNFAVSYKEILKFVQGYI